MVFLCRLSPWTCRMILDLRLDHLGIPRAIYRRRMYSQNTLTVTVLSYWRKIHVFEYFCYHVGKQMFIVSLRCLFPSAKHY
uniref:Uncharacterized protein n=1 Tax=Triticum urartu TaxID=4572 RepID=A0A8R7QRZ3_TRIUA